MNPRTGDYHELKEGEEPDIDEIKVIANRKQMQELSERIKTNTRLGESK